jgi:predicted enzyme related to lactoylglutathione lyase
VIPIARIAWMALDCPEPRELATFYGTVLGMAIDEDRSDTEWVELKVDRGFGLAFQRVDDYTPPQWPDQQHPQQAHLDLEVEDLDAAEAQVLAVGARKHEFQPGRTFRVYLDPVDHPFCLILKQS